MIELPERLQVTCYDNVNEILLPDYLKKIYLTNNAADDDGSSMSCLLLSVGKNHLALHITYDLECEDRVTDLSGDFKEWYRAWCPATLDQLTTLMQIIDVFSLRLLRKKYERMKVSHYTDDFITELTKDTFGFLLRKKQFDTFHEYYTNGFYPTRLLDRKPVPPYVSCYLDIPKAIQLNRTTTLQDEYLKRTFCGIYLDYRENVISPKSINDFFQVD
jgi:hypothetical protein